MGVALTVYPTGTASASTLTTADTLATSAPSSETSHTSKTGKLTGWGELWSQGNTSAWAAGGSEPSPSGHGFILDATTLEGQSILAGTWTPSIKLSSSSGIVTANIHFRAYKRTSAGVYTLIVDCVKATQALTSVAATYTTYTGGSGSQVAFATGDKLYLDVVLQITTNTSTSTSATTSLFQNGGSAESMATPGYSVFGDATLAVTSTQTATGAAGVIGNASLAVTATTAGTGANQREGDASLALSAGLTGAGAAGVVGDASLAVAASRSATGTIGVSGDAALAVSTGIAATGTAAAPGVSGDASLGVGVSATATGSVGVISAGGSAGGYRGLRDVLEREQWIQTLDLLLAAGEVDVEEYGVLVTA